MSESGCPMPVSEVVATLSEIFRHQGRPEVVELLDSAHARFDEIGYDNWNGGTYTWALCLDVPVPIFASLETRLSEIEREIGVKLAPIERNYPNNPIEEVRITPVSSRSPLLGTRMAPSDLEVRRLWPDGRFRLFLSHLSADKVAVSNLKTELEFFGVTAFVAHEDIEPTKEWRDEIELGLKSMHALAALITPEFHGSNWTDQEIGWAMGRNVLVIPIRLGKDPYGFAGKYQGVSGSLDQPLPLARAIVNTLLTNTQTHSEMRRAVVKAFCNVQSFAKAQLLKNIVVTITDFTAEEKAEIQKSCVENTQISGAYGVPEAIYKVVGKPANQVVEPDSEEVPF